MALARFLIGRILVHDSATGAPVAALSRPRPMSWATPAATPIAARPAATARQADRGHAYVYFIYGCWFCLNVSSEFTGIGAGVLLRAVELLEGSALMACRRGTARPRDLARGPGRLATAFGIDACLDGLDLVPVALWLGEADRPGELNSSSVRIGLSKEADRVLRFYERGNLFVSGPASLSP